MNPVQLERQIDGRTYLLTVYNVSQWHSFVAQGCPMPAMIVDEFDRVWEEVSAVAR